MLAHVWVLVLKISVVIDAVKSDRYRQKKNCFSLMPGDSTDMDYGDFVNLQVGRPDTHVSNGGLCHSFSGYLQLDTGLSPGQSSF